MTADIVPLAGRRAHLGRYFVWQLRDYMLHKAPATIMVLVLYGYLTLAPILNGSLTNGRSFDVASLPISVVRQFFGDLLGSFLLLGTLFATNGIVANDRKMGYYRFYFAKPVSAPRFYANAFAASGAGMLIVATLLLGTFAVCVHPLAPPTFLPVVAVMYVGFGGVGFLLSTLFRFDWLSLVTVAIVSTVAWGMWGEESGIRGWVVRVLPPMHRAGEIYRYVAGTAEAFPWTTLIWLTGYGLVCFLLGLWVLRVRQLATT